MPKWLPLLLFIGVQARRQQAKTLASLRYCTIAVLNIKCKKPS